MNRIENKINKYLDEIYRGSSQGGKMNSVSGRKESKTLSLTLIGDRVADDKTYTFRNDYKIKTWLKNRWKNATNDDIDDVITWANKVPTVYICDDPYDRDVKNKNTFLWNDSRTDLKDNENKRWYDI